MRRRAFLSFPALAACAQNRLAADFQRPQYHFLPAANWMNDPNGPIFWKGKYHLFYQYNPNGAFWGTMHWGHATSEDLIHWKHLPVALEPDPGGPDKDGVFSGSAIIHDGVPTLVYTGVRPEVQCLATSDDAMMTWKKLSGNPVIAGPPPGLSATGFRDPCVWQESDGWYMLIGSGTKGVGGSALLYRSPNLIHWTYLHPLFSGSRKQGSKNTNAVASGEMWECPDFFPLGDQHVLFVSTEGTTRYWIGRYAEHRFQPESSGILDFGAYYAPKSFLDRAGRRILWGWIQERRSTDTQKAAGWSGVMSLPRMLTLRPDAALGIEPLPELTHLRGPVNRQSEALEIQARLDPGSGPEVGLEVGGVRILYDASARRLRTEVGERSQSGELSLKAGESLDLHIFLDGSVIEVFANGRVAVTDRVYRQRPGQVRIRSLGAAAPQSLKSWEVQPISADRLTS